MTTWLIGIEIHYIALCDFGYYNFNLRYDWEETRITSNNVPLNHKFQKHKQN